MAVGLVVFPFTLIGESTSEGHLAFAVALVVSPVASVGVTGAAGVGALAVTKIAQGFSLCVVMTRKFDYFSLMWVNESMWHHRHDHLQTYLIRVAVAVFKTTLLDLKIFRASESLYQRFPIVLMVGLK